MMRLAVLSWALLLGLALSTGYAPTVTGHVAGFRLAGIEPDGDPLYQVALQTRLAPSARRPAVNLIVEAYLENFQPDTTPILPDLLHPSRTAQNLGGFLNGKALLTDDAGNVLYIGSFLAEAFLDNSNHAVTRLDGAHGGQARLFGTFVLHKDGSLDGHFRGRFQLPAAVMRQIWAHRGQKMKPLKQILSAVTVRPAPMMGRATKGSPNAALRTGYTPSAPRQAMRPSLWLIAAGAAGAAAVVLAAATVWLEWKARRG